MIICPGTPNTKTSQVFCMGKVKNSSAKSDHISSDMIKKLRFRLNHILLNVSHTIIVTGTAITKLNQLSFNEGADIFKITNTNVATSHTSKILSPVIKP